MIRRAVAAVVTAAVVFGGGVVAEPPATATELAAVARAEVLERVRQAASPDEASTAEVKEPRSKAPAPAGSATLNPGAASTLRADQLGVSAVFSGHEVDRRVTLEARRPADEAKAGSGPSDRDGHQGRWSLRKSLASAKYRAAASDPVEPL